MAETLTINLGQSGDFSIRVLSYEQKINGAHAFIT